VTTWNPVGRSIQASLSYLRRSQLSGYLFAFVGVIATTWVIAELQRYTQVDSPTILYLAVVLGSAVTFGAGPAITASILAVFAYDWQLPPAGTLFIGDDLDTWLALVLFLLVAVVTSELASRQRRRTEEARQREREATALYTLNSLTARSNDPQDFVPDVLRAFARPLGLHSLTLMTTRADGTPEIRVGTPDRPPLSAAEDEKARLVAQTGVPLGLEPLRRRSWLDDSDAHARRLGPIFLPVSAGSQIMGVLQVRRDPAADPLDQEQRRLLAAIAQQFGLALDRERLQNAAAEVAALRRADAMKDALVHSITHDLRTPLALIKASAENLRQEVPWGDDERAAFLANIEHNADRLDKIVSNLLDLSRIDAGLVQPDRQYFPIGSVVDDVVARLGILFTDHPVELDVSDDLPPVPIDYVAIDRVLSNLLENAVRHTPAGTPIRITAHLLDDVVEVAVSDEGPGIGAAALPHVFERFFRGSTPRPDVRRGAGLGLAVAKGLVEAHGGKIRVESSPGHGATFAFTLPGARVKDVLTAKR
jgi:two-component system sensor histidine kinase KdpD